MIGTLLGGVLLAVVSAGIARAQSAEECLACHSSPELERSEPAPGRPASVFVEATALEASVHGGLDCVSCHASASVPHEERLPPVECAACHGDVAEALAGGAHAGREAPHGPRTPSCAACHGSHAVARAASLSPDSCASCHAEQVALFRGSIHGRSRARGNSEAATCGSCHGAAHAALPKADPRGPTYHLNLPRTCAQCHADPELAERHGIPVGDVYHQYMDSIHGRALTRSGLLVAANCSSCHGVHDIAPSANPASRVHRTNVSATCGRCHAGIEADYLESIHGREATAGNPLAPVCIGCHSAHQIRRVEVEAWKLDIVSECGTCHAESLHTYRDTFHGKVTALGFTRVARCSDCHGAHDVRATRDSQSRIHAANLVGTCRQCHPSANANFAKYDPHADPRNRARNPLLHYASRFMTALLVGVFAFFGVHTGLWGIRGVIAKRRGSAPPDEPGESV